jgi:hypothetical protein
MRDKPDTGRVNARLCFEASDVEMARTIYALSIVI